MAPDPYRYAVSFVFGLNGERMMRLCWSEPEPES